MRGREEGRFKEFEKKNPNQDEAIKRGEHFKRIVLFFSSSDKIET